MKKLILPALLFSLAAEAQVSFTKDDFTSATDTSVTYGCNVNSITLGTTGGPQTWDFSNLPLTSAAYSSTWMPTSGTPGFLSDFPSANLVTNGIRLLGNGQLAADSSFSFIKTTDTYSDLLGTYSGDLGSSFYKLKLNTPQRLFNLPFNYQNTLNYSTSGTMTYGYTTSSTTYRTLSGTFTYDAYGKVRFPGSTELVDAARLKKVELVKDSMVTEQEGMSMKTIINYEFTTYTFAGKTNQKSVTILYTKLKSTTSIVIPGSPIVFPPTVNTSADTSVTYSSPITKRGIVSSLDSDFENAGVYKVYPSVTSGKISLSDPSKATAVKIYSLNGAEQPASTDLNNLNIEGLPGIYVVKVTYITGKQKSFKVIKQ